MQYKVKINAAQDVNTEKVFDTFKEAKKYLDNERDEWAEYFLIEEVSGAFFKIWHKCQDGRRLYAGCGYIKKIA